MEIPIAVLVISAVTIFVIALIVGFIVGFIARYRFDRFICMRKAMKNN